MDVSERTEIWRLFSQFTSGSDTPIIIAELRHRARLLCAEFLPGVWKTINDNEFTISKLSGGYTNLIFLCGMADGVKIAGEEPRNALIRIQTQTDATKLIREAVVFKTLADHGYGPKLYGIFEGGRLEEYIPSRILLTEELSEPRIIRHLSSLLCRIHRLHTPTPLRHTSIQQMLDWLLLYEKKNGSDVILEPTVPTLLDVPDTVYPKTITVEGLRTEVHELEGRFRACTSPIVFCHKDMVNMNILWKEGYEISEDGSVTKNGEETDEDPLVLIDFEFGGYECRSFELGSHIGEYGNDFGTDVYPYYKMDRSKATPELKRLFCEGYAKEIHKSGSPLQEGMTGDLERDVDILYKEANDFIEAGALYWGIYCLLYTEDSGLTGMDYRAHAKDRLITYFYYKSLREQRK